MCFLIKLFNYDNVNLYINKNSYFYDHKNPYFLIY